MGAWGAGRLENDTSLDWLDWLGQGAAARKLRQALQRVADNDGYIDADEASEAVAAAELVAALLGQAAPDLPPAVEERLADAPVDADGLACELQPLALVALNRVRMISELRALWDESSHATGWAKALGELERRLRAANPA